MVMLSSGSVDGDVQVDDLGFLSFYEDFLLTHTLRMVGSCNGLICLHDSELMNDSKGISRQHCLNLRDVFLWNPATRQFRILPKSIPIQERNPHPEVYYRFLADDFVAFGFDVKTKDYKVLRITPFIPMNTPFIPMNVSDDVGCMCRVQVYSLSTDSWRLLEGITSLPCIPRQHPFLNHGIYLNGSYFFVGTKSQLGICHYMMLSFDFTKEIFTTMQLPDNNSHVFLSCMGDKIAVFTTPKTTECGCGYEYHDMSYMCDKIPVFTTPNTIGRGCGYEYYDIWVLNEQHSRGCVRVVNEESWTKLHSFRIKNSGLPYGPYISLKCISNNGEFALISTETDDGRRNQLQLFNLVTKEAKKDILIGNGSGGVCRADVYKESLVSIMGGNVLLRWQLPTTHGTYKLNIDAPFIDCFFRFGIGLCLTSDSGACIGVRSLCSHVEDAEEGEALAMLEAIKWAKKLELSPIILESDSKNCLSFLMDDDDDDDDGNLTNCRALSLLREAKLLLNSSELGISFQYCSRSCNYVADVAAKLAREGNWVCKDWTANFPGETVMSLSKDLGLRG